MKQLAILWLDTPRWARGVFLGNICYIVLAVDYFTRLGPRQYWFFTVWSPFFWPTMRTPMDSWILLNHVAWCVLGAICVERWGEIKGILVSTCLIYSVNFALFVIQFIRFNSPF